MVGTRKMPASAMVTDNVTVVPKLVQLGPDRVAGFRMVEPSIFSHPVCLFHTLLN